MRKDKRLERKRYIDLLKVISAFGIVLLHVNINSMHEVQNLLSKNHQIASLSIHQVLYLSVPVFIILTGCGLLASDNYEYKRLWPKILRLILCIVVFGSVFELARIIVRHENISWLLFVTDLINGTTWSHMWYLNKILGVYLILPLLGFFVKNAGRRDIYLLTGILFMFCSVIPWVAGVAGFSISSVLPLGSVFIPYVLTGYILSTESAERCRRAIIVSLPLTVLSIGLVAFYSAINDGMTIRESNPLAVIASISIVLAVKGLEKDSKGAGKFLENISRCTFGIYIIHPVFIHVFVSFLGINPQLKLPVLSVPALAFLIFAISCIVVYLLRKIPFIRRFLL